MLENPVIARSAMSLAEYHEGQELAGRGAVSIERLDSFWRGEHNLTATVRDGETTRTVVLSIGNDVIRNYRCDCGKLGGSARSLVTGLPVSIGGLCRHCVAAGLVYFSQRTRSMDVSIRTSPAARMLLQRYAERALAGSMHMQQQRPVELRPLLQLQNREATLQFRIGREKFYILKDLRAFAAAMEQASVISYGKNLEFAHVSEAFSPESARMAELIVSLVNRQGESEGRGRSGVIRELKLDRYTIDMVMAAVGRQPLSVQFFKEDPVEMPLVDENASITVTVRKKGRDGASVSAVRKLWVMDGLRHTYVCDGVKLYRCDMDYSSRTGMFLEQLFHQYSGTAELDFQKKDLTAFCGQILPQIAGYLEIVTEDIDLSAYEPLPLRTEFYFDMPEQDHVTCEVKQYYGDQEFHPILSDVPDSVYRDLIGEMQVRDTAAAYFPFRDEEGRLVIHEDPERLYDLLSEGLTKFAQCGTVFVTDAFRGLRMQPVPKMKAKVSLQSDLLQLTLEISDLEREELAGLLESYRSRKKYHRLRDGSFLSLEQDNSLTAVQELAEAVGQEDALLSGEEVQLKPFYGFYLDQTLRKEGQMQLVRDEAFVRSLREWKDEAERSFAVPVRLESVMRPYQKDGYQWLRLLDRYHFGGVLADEMGLGKSLQVIAVLAHEAEKQDSMIRERSADGSAAVPGTVQEQDAEAAYRDATSLLVCPASLLYNWQSEFEKFAPWLKVLPVAGDAAERAELLTHWQAYDVLITSYDLLRRDQELYAGMHFRFQIIDEAQYIKNYETQNARAVKLVKAQTRFALTGTPVENRLSELWSIFDYLMQGFLGTYGRFREHIELPVMRHGDERAMHRLQKLTAPFILRREKKDVLQELPAKLETVVYSALHGEQKRLYTASVVRMQELLREVDESAFKKSKIQVLAELTRLRQLCCDPAICLEGYEGGAAKLDTCMELVRSSVDGGHKILLFSQFTTMLARIEQRLQKAGIRYHLLTGATPKEKRMAMVNQFARDDIPVFLISLKAGGTGLNLTAADVVIHYDPWWNAAAENQATDRAHRIGQKHTVSVFKLIAKHTVEEKILHLQEQKKELLDRVLEGETGMLASMNKEELLELLTEPL